MIRTRVVYRDARESSDNAGPNANELDSLQLARRELLTKELSHFIEGNTRRKAGLDYLKDSLRHLEKMDGMFGGFKTHTGEPMRDEIDDLRRNLAVSLKIFTSADNSLLQAQSHVKARRRKEDAVWDPSRVREIDERDEAQKALEEMMAGKAANEESAKEGMATELNQISERVGMTLAEDMLLTTDLDEERKEIVEIEKDSLANLIFLGGRANETRSELEQWSAHLKKVMETAEEGLEPINLQWNGFETAEDQREGSMLPEFVEESERSVGELLANTYYSRDRIRALVMQMKAGGTDMEHRVKELGDLVDTLTIDLRRVHEQFDQANKQFAEERASLLRKVETEKLMLQTRLDSKYAAEMEHLERCKADIKRMSKEAADKDARMAAMDAEVVKANAAMADAKKKAAEMTRLYEDERGLSARQARQIASLEQQVQQMITQNRASIDIMQKQLNQARARSEELSMALDQTSEERDRLTKQMALSGNQGSNDAKALADAHTKVADLQRKLQHVSEEKRVMSMQCEQLEDKVKSLMSSVGEMMSSAGMGEAAEALSQGAKARGDEGERESQRLETVKGHIEERVQATEEEIAARVRAREMQLEERERGFLQHQRQKEEELEQGRKEIQEIKGHLKQVEDELKTMEAAQQRDAKEKGLDPKLAKMEKTKSHMVLEEKQAELQDALLKERSEFRKEMQRERSILDGELRRMRLEAAAEEEKLQQVLEERKRELVQATAAAEEATKRRLAEAMNPGNAVQKSPSRPITSSPLSHPGTASMASSSSGPGVAVTSSTTASKADAEQPKHGANDTSGGAGGASGTAHPSSAGPRLAKAAVPATAAAGGQQRPQTISGNRSLGSKGSEAAAALSSAKGASRDAEVGYSRTRTGGGGGVGVREQLVTFEDDGAPPMTTSSKISEITDSLDFTESHVSNLASVISDKFAEHEREKIRQKAAFHLKLAVSAFKSKPSQPEVKVQDPSPTPYGPSTTLPHATAPASGRFPAAKPPPRKQARSVSPPAGGAPALWDSAFAERMGGQHRSKTPALPLATQFAPSSDTPSLLWKPHNVRDLHGSASPTRQRPETARARIQTAPSQETPRPPGAWSQPGKPAGTRTKAFPARQKWFGVMEDEEENAAPIRPNVMGPSPPPEDGAAPSASASASAAEAAAAAAAGGGGSFGAWSAESRPNHRKGPMSQRPHSARSRPHSARSSKSQQDEARFMNPSLVTFLPGPLGEGGGAGMRGNRGDTVRDRAYAAESVKVRPQSAKDSTRLGGKWKVTRDTYVEQVRASGSTVHPRPPPHRRSSASRQDAAAAGAEEPVEGC